MEGFSVDYVMGLIVGERSFTGDKKKPCIGLKLHKNDPIPLNAVQKLLGGRIYGFYDHDRRKYRMLLVRGKDLKSAVDLIERKLPQSRKRELFIDWRKKWAV